MKIFNLHIETSKQKAKNEREMHRIYNELLNITKEQNDELKIQILNLKNQIKYNELNKTKQKFYN